MTITNNPVSDFDTEFAALLESGCSPSEALAQLRVDAPTATTFTVDDAVSQFLSRQTDRTRRSYRTHLRRVVDGVGPVCSQSCQPCVTPVSTQLFGDDGEPKPGRRNVFECRCDCRACRDSRIVLVPHRELPFDASTMTSALVSDVATVALRLAKKNGVFENSRRLRKNKPAKTADGYGAKETAIAAMRALLKANSKAVDGYDGCDVNMPSRSTRSRRALLDFELLELVQLTEISGNDPEVDSLLVEFGLVTGARREGALLQTVGRLNAVTQMIGLKDKYDRVEEVPVSADLVARMQAHAIERGGSRCDPTSPDFDPESPAFWVRSQQRGIKYQPVTSRRFDTLHGRWQTSMDWAGHDQVGYHHLRHTMAQVLKARFGQHVAQRYLRHSDQEVTDRYGRCSDAELAQALATLFDFTHPLVDGIADRRAETLRRLGLKPNSD